MAEKKIVVIGAGSASFGLNTVSALLSSAVLRGSRLSLVDQNPQALDLMFRLAQRLNQEWGTEMSISRHAHHGEALQGADFVVSAVEVAPRERLWRSDYEIPLKFGIRQPYAENGGPGGFAHAARNIMPVLGIVHDMEKACPDAWVINYTNPMSRICDAVARHSQIRVVGLCHQIHAAYGMLGYLLADDLGFERPHGVVCTHSDPQYWDNLRILGKQASGLLDIQAAGLNHFTWVLSVRHRLTRKDLYPLVKERWAGVEKEFEPLTQRVMDAFGVMPVPGDEHLCEYLPWASDPLTKPWEKYELSLYDWDSAEKRRTDGHAEIARMADGLAPIDGLRDCDSEGAREVIENIACAGSYYHPAANLPNDGCILNLPIGAIVETPAVFSAAGVNGVSVGTLPKSVAELCRREITVTQLCVDAVVQGDRQKALQCLLLDPVITDMDVAKQILDAYLTAYREHLPTFWK